MRRIQTVLVKAVILEGLKTSTIQKVGEIITQKQAQLKHVLLVAWTSSSPTNLFRKQQLKLLAPVNSTLRAKAASSGRSHTIIL